MNLTGKSMIGSTFSVRGTGVFHAVNPTTADNLAPPFYEATAQDIDEAAEKAALAFQVYRSKTGPQRAEFLEAIADEILAVGDELITRCMEETGLPEGRLKNERIRTINQLKLFAAHVREGSWVDARIDRSDPERMPPKPDIRSMLIPVGPVAVFGASNFPLAFSVAGGDTASALAAGCPVICKAHPAHPGTSELVAASILKAAQKTGMPEGVFSLLQGKTNDTGLRIVQHPAISAIGFTGSFRGGKAIFDAANARPVPIPVYAEMGSTNPVFVLPGAVSERLESMAKDLSASVTLGVGQFCTNPGLVVIPDSSEGGRFIDELSKAIGGANCGVMLTPAIRDAYKSGIQKLLHVEGVAKRTQGDGSGLNAEPAFFQTSAATFLSEPELEEEIFGPSTLGITVSGKEELLRVARNLRGHLTATIHATDSDLENYSDLISILEQKVGRLIINGYPTGVEVTHAMVHSGPFPASTDSRTTSVGTMAIRRFARHVCYQNFPQSRLPEALRDGNPLAIWRLVNGQFTTE